MARRLVRVLRESSPPEVVATQKAGLRAVFEDGMDSQGQINWTAGGVVTGLQMSFVGLAPEHYSDAQTP